MEKTKAFTMAEVLITLGILGVIAAMTLPAFYGNYKKYVNVVILKKAYSDIQRLFLEFKVDTVCYDDLNSCFPEEGQFRDEFAKYLNTKKGFHEKFSQPTQIEVNLLGTKPVHTHWLINYSPINSEGNTNKLLIAPGGAYILGFELNGGRDNFYQLRENGKVSTPPNYFRASIVIYTDSNKVNDVRDNSIRKVSTIGRERFNLFIMSDGQIIPNGSTKCKGGFYDCGDVTESPLLCDTNNPTQNLNNGSLCFGKIIGDGWQMKY